MSTFLDNSNIELLFSNVSSRILSITNYNMQSNQKYKNVFKQLLETINETINTNNASLEYLNNLAIKKTIPFMTDIINKEQNPSNYDTSKVSRPKDVLTHPPKADLKIKTYDSSNVNELLSGLTLGANTKPNHLQIPSDNDNKNKNVSYDEFIKSRNEFNNQVTKSEISQKMVLNKINEKKQQNNKDFYAAMKPTIEDRKDLQFDPKDMYKDLMKTGKKVITNHQTNLNPPDLSEVNQIKESNPEVEKMLNNDWLQKDIKESSTISKDELFQNPGYVTERLKRKIIMIDTGYSTDTAGLGGNLKSNLNTTTDTVVISNTGNYWDDFTVKFLEPLVIDNPCEVLMESLIIKNSVSSSNTQTFCLKFNEFTSQISSNNPNINNKFMVTNKNSPSNNEKILKTSSARYITNLNPITISSLTINLTDQDGNNSTTTPNSVFASSINRTSDVTIINGVSSDFTTNTITLDTGTLDAALTIGDIISVTGSTSNNGFFTVSTAKATTDNNIVVKESLTVENNASITVKLTNNQNNRFMMELLFKEL